MRFGEACDGRTKWTAHGDTAIVVAGRRRLPTYCSSGCRHRAWEQRRAAASGLAAVRVVERPVEVRVERTVERVTEVSARPRGSECADQLRDLAWQLDAGRLYDRDLDVVIEALKAVNDAVARRTRHRRRRPTEWMSEWVSSPTRAPAPSVRAPARARRPASRPHRLPPRSVDRSWTDDQGLRRRTSGALDLSDLRCSGGTSPRCDRSFR